jgi:hypothetical protein
MKMKTKNLLPAIVGATVAAASLAPLGAAEPFLSPRAKANQIRTVPGVTEEKLDRANLFKPRSAFWGHTVARGSGSDRNLVTEGRHLTASPKALAAHPQLFQRGVKPAPALPACCKTMTRDECGMACFKDTGAKCGGACCKS